ncbi:MAG: glycosyltransferase family 39 protein [Candidatus Hydrogenedentes bacterium]|nr:glycosyltransferase family 39 protein [Candidatus Hydrogenedentota bacterium]
MNSKRFFILLILAACFSVGLHLGHMDVVTDNEGQRATPPMEMLRDHNMLIPTINGVDYLVKPPLLYWAIAFVYKTTGVISPLTARIPTAACGIALVLCVYFLLRREGGELQARWGALIMAVAPYALDRMRWAELDIPLTLGVFLSIVALWRAARAERAGRAAFITLAGGVAFGAAIMLKGPAAFLFLWAAAAATLIVNGDKPNRRLISCIKWCAGAFVLEVLLKCAAAAIPSLSRPLGTPVALAIVLLACSHHAWYGAPRLRLRVLACWLGIMLVGIALAAPWGIAVLQTKGWDYISAMLNNQVVERTYTASSINSGPPWYYFVALPVMLAPWGLLLPLHLSPNRWNSGTTMYRFSVLMGMLSVLVFSLIAGKEYEYVLPCVPFIVFALGVHLTILPKNLSLSFGQAWTMFWIRAWTYFAPVAAIGAAIAFTTQMQEIRLNLAIPESQLLVTIWILAVIAAVIPFVLRGVAVRRVICAYILALCAVGINFTFLSYKNTGKRSPKEIATLAGEIRRGGYDIEAAKVYPAFAFYARTPIPLNIDPAAIRAKLASDKPFFYAVRKRDLNFTVLQSGPIEGLRTLVESKYKNDMLIVGNTDLPELPKEQSDKGLR